MNMKALWGAAIAVASLSLTACGGTGDCSVTTNADGAVITCADGTRTTIRNGSNGQDGAAGEAGASAIVKTVPVEPGEACPTGGTRVLTGQDSDGDLELGDEEIETDTLVCNGADGADGADGSDGLDGAPGVNALVETAEEPAGENCVNGGLKVTAGLDTNGNGALDNDEVSSTNFVCNDQNVIFVDDDSASVSEDGTKANPFKSIQAAIDSAADGSVIFVREGHYTDSLQIVNRNRLTVRGEGINTVIAPAEAIATGVAHKYASDNRTNLFVNGSVGVTIENLTVTSAGMTWGGSAGLDAIVFWHGSSGTLKNVLVDGNSSTLTGVQSGQGLAVGASAGVHTQLQVVNAEFRGWNKNAIDAVNAVGGGSILLDVQGGTFTAAPTGVTAQNGILFWNRGESVSGTVDGVTLEGIEYTGEQNTSAAGILSYGTANLTEVRNSTFNGVNRYIANETANEIDATQNNTFDGVVGSAATEEELVTIAAKVKGPVVLQ